MTANWVRIYNRLLEILNTDGATYFSGGRFISKVREVDPYFPDYNQFISNRKGSGKSTSRKDYFYDIFLDLGDERRIALLNRILEEIEESCPEKVAEIRGEMGGTAAVPTAMIAKAVWNAERLNGYLRDIDSRIAAGKYDGAVTLAYTCLEGFLKAFTRQKELSPGDEIVALSRTVRAHLRESIATYPAEALSMVNHIAHAVDRARNEFSESHFDDQAGRWLAVFIRDLVNSEIRLLLHFMEA
jgi:hypothetical protein